MNKIPLLIILLLQVNTVSATPYSTQNINSLFKKIENYNPSNKRHKEIVDASRILCGKVYTDIISTLAANTGNEPSENVQSTFLYAIEKAGACTYNAYYKHANYKTLEIYGNAAQYHALSTTNTSKVAQEKSERLAGAACRAIKSKLIENTINSPQRHEEIPNAMFEDRVYCMALLGQHSGIGSAIETYNLSTD